MEASRARSQRSRWGSRELRHVYGMEGGGKKINSCIGNVFMHTAEVKEERIRAASVENKAGIV